MSYPVDTSHTSPNQSTRGTTKIGMLVLHSTAGSYASSLDWLCNPASKVSAHYLIRKDGHIAQLVHDERAAWHAGKSAWMGMNSDEIQRSSIGIELENKNTGRDPYPSAQLDACRELCRALIARYAIPRALVVRHLDIAILPKGRKTDPAGFPWASFVQSLYDRAARDYDVIGLPVYQRSDRTGELWGYLLAGEHVTIDDRTTGHLADGRGFVDLRGLVTRPK